MIATPPAEVSVSLLMTVAAGNRVDHIALSAVVQCVSWSSTTFPASSHLRINCLLLALAAVWGSTSHLTFHEAKPGPSDPRRSRSALSMSSAECPLVRCAQVVPAGVGVPCSSVQSALGDRIRMVHWRDLVHSKMDSRCMIQDCDLAMGRRSLHWGRRSRSQSEVRSAMSY